MNQPLGVVGVVGQEAPSLAYAGYVLVTIFMVTVFKSCVRTIVPVLLEDI